MTDAKWLNTSLEVDIHFNKESLKTPAILKKTKQKTHNFCTLVKLSGLGECERFKEKGSKAFMRKSSTAMDSILSQMEQAF